MTYGEALKKWRDSKGWTQTDAAERVGVTQGCFASWEIGRAFPDLGNALRVDKVSEGEVPASLAAKRSRKAAHRTSRRTGTDG